MRSMKKFTIITILFAAIPPCAYSQTDRPAFAAFSVHGRDASTPEFSYSSTSATATSPIVISVEGRDLKSKDRDYRVDLQKNWISTNVPANYELIVRDLVVCKARKKSERPFCDRYEFEDPVTGESHDYFFYVGNWP